MSYKLYRKARRGADTFLIGNDIMIKLLKIDNRKNRIEIGIRMPINTLLFVGETYIPMKNNTEGNCTAILSLHIGARITIEDKISIIINEIMYKNRAVFDIVAPQYITIKCYEKMSKINA